MSRPPLCIVSWNVRKAVGLDWRRDPVRVLAVLGGLGADVVLLQEADKRLPPRHAALPPALLDAAGWHSLDPDPSTPSIGHHGNAILLRYGVSATHITALDLPGTEPRGAILARILGPFGAVTVGGLHLGLRHGDRIRQVDRAVTEAVRLGGPAILGGDLNEWRTGRDTLMLRPGWRMMTPGPSFHAARPIFQLDRFLLGPDTGHAEVETIPPDFARRASDHLPIRLRTLC